MADAVLLDPQGRAVVLHDSTWLRHIVRQHPELSGDRAQIEAAITAPHSIHESSAASAHPTGVIYYGDAGRQGVMLKVATEEVSSGATTTRIVKTAHYAKRVSAGSQLWP